MGFDGQRRMVPIPGQNAVADGDVAGQGNDEAMRHRVDEGRALLDRPHLLPMKLGKGGARHRAQPIRQRRARSDRAHQLMLNRRIAAKHDPHDV